MKAIVEIENYFKSDPKNYFSKEDVSEDTGMHSGTVARHVSALTKQGKLVFMEIKTARNRRPHGFRVYKWSCEHGSVSIKQKTKTMRSTPVLQSALERARAGAIESRRW